MEPRFKKGDYMINRSSGDIGIVDSIKKNYYHFKAYYRGMTRKVESYDVTLQVYYDQFYEPCTDDEKKIIDDLRPR